LAGGLLLTDSLNALDTFRLAPIGRIYFGNIRMGTRSKARAPLGLLGTD